MGETSGRGEDDNVSANTEQVIERLRRMNDTLKSELKKHMDRIREQTKDNQRYREIYSYVYHYC